MIWRVIFTPEAEQQLTDLYRYIANAASPNSAARYVDAIITYCEGLSSFPQRGTQRDDVRPGLRVTHYKKRAVIAFTAQEEVVSIIGVFYGGQNHEAILQEAALDFDHIDHEGQHSTPKQRPPPSTENAQ